MILNNADMIEQAERMFACEIEPLYWKIEDALEDGKTEKAKGLFLIMMYAAKYNKKLIVDGLKSAHRKRLKELSFEFFGNSVLKEQQIIEVKQPIAPIELPFDKESELKQYLIEHVNVLSEALNDRIISVETEVESQHGYRCDIVVESKRYFYPIELKIRQSTHAVVSQCAKYCFYFYRKLRYNRYKEVQGAVISNGLDVWSVNELRRQGIWCFIIKLKKKNDIVLEKVE